MPKGRRPEARKDVGIGATLRIAAATVGITQAEVGALVLHPQATSEISRFFSGAKTPDSVMLAKLLIATYRPLIGDDLAQALIDAADEWDDEGLTGNSIYEPDPAYAVASPEVVTLNVP